MTLYYFHLEDGQTLHDEEGMDLPNLAAAQDEALRSSGDFLRDGPVARDAFWKGTPWRLWVTDKPNGEGKTLFALRFSAEMEDATFNFPRLVSG